MKRQLPGLMKFYMTGHRVEPGEGLPSALRKGRKMAQLICRFEGVAFTIA